ncbi:hypothetical protein BO71DRAFT_487702 [Aspergillus ellipticus CBS 707.79]|uniref:Uncharacterized protein n=1 Tax=Aspergillus ellipticus CBS 707.79 TaxID=1448320 RepID=A0A319D5F1_9EURO|nr:hypothetical protein BO71DRAFT_487702 [Aspergillus ellipticus CBS 707.79]
MEISKYKRRMPPTLTISFPRRTGVSPETAGCDARMPSMARSSSGRGVILTGTCNGISAKRGRVEARVKAIWTIIKGYSRDKLPRPGHVLGNKDIFIIAGWIGHRMPEILLAAQARAAMVVDKEEYCPIGLPRVLEEKRWTAWRKPQMGVLESWSQTTQRSRL